MTFEKIVHAEKARALKKYEADPCRCFTSLRVPAMEIYSPFGPMIGRTRVPELLVNRLNTYADDMRLPDTSTEFILPDEVVDDGSSDSLVAVTRAFIENYLKEVEDTAAGHVEFEVFWIVNQYQSTPSPVHFHSGDISGVLFLKEPGIIEGEEIKTYISGRQAGYLNFLAGGKQRFSKSLISFKPQVGDFYVFPGWLLHGAEPFRGTGERRSLAFNAYIRSI